MRRLIAAPPERVFSAWTNPAELKKWWGPAGVRCVSAEVELQVGGRYKIENALPNGETLWIAGEFEQIEKPHLLVYTWFLESENPAIERVSIRFDRHESGTEIVLTHEQIATPALQEQHQLGWNGCFDGLADHLDEISGPNGSQ